MPQPTHDTEITAPAATDEPAPERRCGIIKPHPAHDTMWGRRLYRCPGITVPALAVIGAAMHEWAGCHEDAHDEWCNEYIDTGAHAVVAALEANGHVVLARPELDAMTAALHNWSCGWEVHSLDCQRATAVVEAVGPTREDTSNG